MTTPLKDTQEMKRKTHKCGLKHIHNYYNCCAACIHGEHPSEGASGHVKTCKYFKPQEMKGKKCSNCQHYSPGKSIMVDRDGNCIDCGREVTPLQPQKDEGEWDKELELVKRMVEFRDKKISGFEFAQWFHKVLSSQKKQIIKNLKKELKGWEVGDVLYIIDIIEKS